MKRILEDFEYIYFFKDAFNSKLIGRPYLINENGFNEDEIKEAKEFIKKNGTNSILLMMMTLIKLRVIITQKMELTFRH